MNFKFRLLAGSTVVSVFALTALPQDAVNLRTEENTHSRDGAHSLRRADRLNGAAKASDIIGMVVKNNQDEKLGKVEDLAIDVESGRIVQVILSTGGFTSGALTAVPATALHHDVANKVLHLDIDKKKLENAPKFEMSNWSENSSTNHLSEIYGYYGQDSSLGFVQSDEAVPELDHNADADRHSYNRESRIPVSRLGQVQKASKLIGMPVKNVQDEKLGKVDNLLLDMTSGRVVAVVISSGGFLGIGDELSAVPPVALRFATDREGLQLDTTKEMLGKAPHFKTGEWPDFGQPEYVEGVYRAYSVDPYFSTNSIAHADNTARNVRDRNNSALTPLSQGNSKSDVATTAQIRREIVAGKDMSVNAKNVKIITVDGRVTLRGPVNTAEEKRQIGEIANNLVQLANVDNQLEVK